MINKQKLWFLTLFSLILVLSVYYIALPEKSLSNLTKNEENISANAEVYDEDTLSALRIEDDETVLAEMEDLQETL